MSVNSIAQTSSGSETPYAIEVAELENEIANVQQILKSATDDLNQSTQALNQATLKLYQDEQDGNWPEVQEDKETIAAIQGHIDMDNGEIGALNNELNVLNDQLNHLKPIL